ncbi:MAG: phytoene desaturase family protein [Thermodesulfobacteriota bacterium]
MRNKWDTIIVGAGLGGLTAAAKLVGAGRRVLILERNPHPGGTAYVYNRRGFSFPMGPLGFSHPGLVRSILRDVNVEDNLALHRVHYRIRAFGCDVPLTLPSAEMVKALSERFPSDAQAVEMFFQEMKAILSPSSHPNSKTDSSAPADLYRSSASDYLSRRIRDWRLRRILGSIGTREPYSGLPLLAAMWKLMTEEGIWYPESGLRVLSEKLVEAVTGRSDAEKASEVPGEIKLGTEVSNIRVENGKVVGVTLRDGSKIDSPSVVSNADYKTTFLSLLDRRKIPSQWYRAVHQARQTGSILQVSLGVDKGKTDLSSFHEASRLIYRSREAVRAPEGIDWNAVEIDPASLAKEELEVSLWSKEDESLAPGGEAVVVIRTEAEYSHFARFRLGWRKRAPGYEAYKTRLGNALVKEAENLIPGLEGSIQVMDVATPLTFEDQGGRSGGAVAGWSWDYEDFQDEKPKELIRTPIQGLYMAGYQAFSALFAGGIPTAMESGKRAAQTVLEEADPIEEILIPGMR